MEWLVSFLLRIIGKTHRTELIHWGLFSQRRNLLIVNTKLAAARSRLGSGTWTRLQNRDDVPFPPAVWVAREGDCTWIADLIPRRATVSFKG